MNHLYIIVFMIGVLFYLSSGVLPMLVVYYEQFFKLPAQKEERRKQLTVTSHILSALLVSVYV